MKKRLAVLAAFSVMLALTPVSYAQTAAPPMAPGMQEPQERHPEIHKAIHALEHAKAALEHAAHDYNGHRTRAIEAIDAALQELHQALAVSQ